MIKSGDNLIVARVLILIEIVCVTVVTIMLIKLLRNNLNGQGTWFVAPFVLIMAAVVPTRLRKRSFAEIGLRIGRLGLIFRMLCAACVIVFPLLLAGVFLLKHFEVQLLLCPVIPENGWISWLVYQFMYIAVAEEMFFRGYLQSNVLCLLTTSIQKNRVFLNLIGIIVSAIVFAISHSVILGSVMPMITFFPGLIFGWLFVKTESLLAPILFHGLANIYYAFIGMVLV